MRTTLNVRVPANMTNLFQPLDLTVNRSAKAFMTRKLTEWYSLQITKQLDSGKNCDEIEVKLLLSTLKPLHASWIIELYNHLTSSGGREIIVNGWEAADITNAIKKGASSLDPLDPFSSIDSLEQPTDDGIFSQQTTSPIAAELVQANYESDDEDEWVVEDSQIEDVKCKYICHTYINVFSLILIFKYPQKLYIGLSNRENIFHEIDLLF